MASILSSVNQTDIIIDKPLSSANPYSGSGGSGGASGGGGANGGSAGGDSGANYTTGTSPAVWFSYNSSSTHTIENSNASRHFADHPEASGAVGMEAIIIVVVVSLIPVSVIACMVFVISFNCLKRRSSLWSTTASPEATERNLVGKAQAQLARVDSGVGGGGGDGNSNRRKSAIHSMMDEESLTDADLFDGGRGEHSDQIAMIETPLSLIYPADAFSAAAYLDTSKSSLTTPISNNSVITMTMRNNHLIVETEERIPISAAAGVGMLVGPGANGGDARNTCTSNIYAQCQVEEYAYELNDDSVLDETDSFCENRYCQHGTTCVAENGCAFCQDYGDEDDDDDQNAFYDTGTTATVFTHATSLAPAATTTTTAIDNCNRPARTQTDEEDQPVQLFHKDIAAVTEPIDRHRPTVQLSKDDVSRDVYEIGRVSPPQIDANADVAVRKHTGCGYSQSDVGGSSRRAQNHYVYGNQSEYVVCGDVESGRSTRFAPNRWRRHNSTAANIGPMSSSPVSWVLSPSPSPPLANSVHLQSANNEKPLT